MFFEEETDRIITTIAEHCPALNTLMCLAIQTTITETEITKLRFRQMSTRVVMNVYQYGGIQYFASDLVAVVQQHMLNRG